MGASAAVRAVCRKECSDLAMVATLDPEALGGWFDGRLMDREQQRWMGRQRGQTTGKDGG